MLIDDAATLRRWARIEFNFTFTRAEPWIEQAERDFLRPTIGEEMYALLLDHHDTSASDETLDEALRLSQRALSLITMFYMADVFQVQMDDTGMHVVANETHKTPYEWQKGNWEQRYLGAGMNALEDLLEFLEQHQLELDEWRTSTAFTEHHACLIRTAKEFNAELPINGSRITYLDLRPALKRAQALLGVELGNDFIAELVAHQEHEDSDSSSEVQDSRDTAIAMLRTPLAHLTVAEAKEVHFKRVNGAILSTRHTDSSTNKVEGTAEENASLRRNCRETAMVMLAVARKWLDEHAAEFSSYTTSPGYRPDGAEQIPTEDRIHNSGGAALF